MNQEYNNQVPVQDPMVQQYQQPVMEQPITEPPKKKKTGLIIAIIIFIFLIIGGVVAGVVLKDKILGGDSDKKKDSKPLETDEDTSSGNYVLFFMSTTGGYDIYRSDGKKINKEPVSNYQQVNKTYLVADKEGKRYILDASGKTIVKDNKYTSISPKGPFYIAKKEDKDGKSVDVLLSGETGKELREVEYDDYQDYYNTNKLIRVGEEMFDEHGKKVGDLEPGAESYSDEHLSVGDDGKYAVLTYKAKVHIYDLTTFKEIASFDDKTTYLVTGEGANGAVGLTSTKGWDSSVDRTLKYIYNGKVVFTKTVPNQVILEIKGTAPVAYDQNSYTETVLDNDGNAAFNIENGGYQYIDAKNYAKKADSKVEIYADGNLVNTINDCSFVDDNAIVGSFYEICGDVYKKDGTRLKIKDYEISGSDYQMNDKAGNSIIYIEGYSKNHSLINSSGELLLEFYDDVEKAGGSTYDRTYDVYYEVASTNRNAPDRAIFDSKGKLIVQGVTDRSYLMVDDNKDILYGKIDGKWVVYDLTNRKELGKYDNKPESVQRMYYKVVEGDKTNYYSYFSGEKFYSE